MLWSPTLRELPFFPAAADPLVDSMADKFLDGFQKKTYPSDGFTGFHSIKLCSSNARQISKLLQLTYGFQEIAYKGLETNSTYTASHVLKNGGVVIEITNTLATVSSISSDTFARIGTLFNKCSLQRVKDDFAQVLHLEVDNFMNSAFPGSLLEKFELESKIRESTAYKQMFQSIETLQSQVLDEIITNVEDFVDSYVISTFLKNHGEGILDVSLQVEDVETVFSKATYAGAMILKPPRVAQDKYGSVKMATIIIPDTDICHTLIENIDYTGPYLPGYMRIETDPSEVIPAMFNAIDHCVENYTWNEMMSQAKIYAKMFGFNKFWSVDDKDVYTGNTSLRSIVMVSANGKIKIPINEPAEGKFKSQIEEFYDFNNGPGFQHIALRTNDIINTVRNLRSRGVLFNETSKTYYNSLFERLKKDDVVIEEDLEQLKSLNILVDYEPGSRNKRTKKCNYILQIFTHPLHDRPTFFFEVIQRRHHNGFGKGTFKGLFESIEEQQRKRGTLVPSKLSK